MKQLAFDFSVATPPTLDNFVAGSNAEVLERVRALVRGASDERFVYLWGGRGSGRTHLLRAAIASLDACGARSAYVRCSGATAPDDALHALDAVALDDVDELTPAGQAGLFSVYNAMREKGGTLIAAGNVAPKQLALRADVVTRLGWGLVYEVHALTDAEKARALAERASARGFTLQPDVSQYLLTHARRDMAALLEMLDALDRYSLEAKRPVTVPLLRELLAAERK